MKKVITTALLAALLASTAAEAFAQDAPRGRAGPQRERSEGSQERSRTSERVYEAPPAPPPAPRSDDNGRRAGRAGIIRRDDPHPAPQPAPPPQARPAPQAQPAPRPPSVDNRYGGGHDRSDRDRRDGDRRDWDRHSGDQRNNDYRPRGGDPRWNDNHRPHDRDRPRYDRRYYPPVYQNQHRYRTSPYRPPSGWFTFNWSFGDVLPGGWYGQQYRLMDWWSYGLPMPPIGYEWVRVGDDALLVDTFSGRVVQVAYNLFW